LATALLSDFIFNLPLHDIRENTVEPAKECRPTQTVFIFGGLHTDIKSTSMAGKDLGDCLVFPVIGGSGGKEGPWALRFLVTERGFLQALPNIFTVNTVVQLGFDGGTWWMVDAVYGGFCV
jgi:hypothetical protein